MREVPSAAVVVVVLALATVCVAGVAVAHGPTPAHGGTYADVTAADGSDGATFASGSAGATLHADGQNETNEDRDTTGTNASTPVSGPETREAIVAGERLVEPCAAEPPDDRSAPADERAIGWVDGYWYDEQLAIENETLTEDELEALVARTAARVEALRCLEFESVPPVIVVERSDVADEQTAAVRNRSTAAAQFDDARLAATLLLPASADPGEARVATTSGAALGSYDPETGEITLVAEDANATSVDEVTLAHELLHALQDQHFDLESYDASRTDVALAETALIEGDAVLVEHRYEQRCSDDGWNESCVRTSPPETEDEGSVALSLLYYQPYNDGPLFVAERYDRGGWSAVDALYDEPPTTTAAILDEESVGDYERPFLPIVRSTHSEWERIRPDDAPASDYLGPGAIGATLLAPTFEGSADRLYDPEGILDTPRQPGTGPSHEYDYRVDAVEGWHADRLVAFENDGETAAVWASTWETEADAETFQERYVELLAVRGASPTDDVQGTFRFSTSSEYDGAVYVEQRGADVVVAHAPSVDALESLYPGVGADPSDGYASSVDRPDPSQGLPADTLRGFTLVLAAFAMAAVALVAVLRQRRQ